jgi:F-type H+-transporting ATPase subunit c
MSRSRLMALWGLMLLVAPVLAAAQEAPPKAWQTIAFAHLAAGIGAGLTIIGGAAGIGRLAAAALEGIARQPNAAGDIRGAMIVAAGLIEGVTFFALIVTILLAIKA